MHISEDHPDWGDDLIEATQTLFDDVDKIVQRMQNPKHNPGSHGQWVEEIAEGLLILAKAIQTLRPSSEQNPNPIPARDHQLDAEARSTGLRANGISEESLLDKSESSQDPDLEKLQALAKGSTLPLTWEEHDLIQHMRKEKLSADKLTTFLKDEVPHQSPLGLLRLLREENKD